MKFLRKIVVTVKNSSTKIGDHIGIYANLTVGVALIAGANAFAMAYIPIALLSVSIASAGTFIGTFVCANALMRRRRQDISEEVELEVSSKSEIEKLKRERDEAQGRAQKLREENTHLRQQGMNVIEFNPELKLTFLSMNYKKYDFYEEILECSCGKKGKFCDDDPYERKYQGVYYVEGTLEYEIDLAGLKVIQEGNVLIFCGEILPTAKALWPKKKSVLLKQETLKTWDFDKNKYGNRGELEVHLIKDKINESSINCSPQKKQEERLRDSLTKSDAEYVKDFSKLAKRYLTDVFAMTGMEIRFDSQRKGCMTLPEFIGKWNAEAKRRQLEASEASAIF